MERKKFVKWLAASLAAVMLVQTAVPQYAVYAQETDLQENVQEEVQEEAAVPQLQNGTAVIPAGADAAAVKEILGHGSAEPGVGVLLHR